ncbi:hypothetical protein BCR44DRAFT_1424302, partial [Catenaria anguillulae PL171]
MCRQVIDTMKPLDGDRKAFRLVGGVLMERTVKEVLPALEQNLEGDAVGWVRPFSWLVCDLMFGFVHMMASASETERVREGHGLTTKSNTARSGSCRESSEHGLLVVDWPDR